MTDRLELGLFLPNTSGGTIIAASTPPKSVPTFAENRDITLAAERAGFDFVLSQVKWRGYGGPSRQWDVSLESFTLMSALAAVTSRIRLYASVAIRTMHPAVAAKMAATIDEVSGGRFGVNIVAGWNKFEYAQMGLWAEDDYFSHRYAYADEYLAVLQQLWTQEATTVDGRFFKLDDCRSWPKPARPLPIVCAGQSDDAIAFTSKGADFAFVGRMNDTVEKLGALSAKIDAAAATHGRSVGSYVLMTVIAAPTDEEALTRRDHYLANADKEAIAEWLRASGQDAHRIDYDRLPPIQQTFMGIHYIAASYSGVAAHLDALAKAGVRGACFVFPDFARDLDDFIANVLPLCESRAG